MPVVPMFHVNAWGLPYAAPMTGAKLVFPGPKMDGASLYEMIELGGVTVSAGVPTIWAGLIRYMQDNGKRFSTLTRTIVGGSAAPRAMIETFQNELRRGTGACLGHDGNLPHWGGIPPDAAHGQPFRGRKRWRCGPSRAARSTASG